MTFHRDEIWVRCKLTAPKYGFDPLLLLAVATQEAQKDRKNPLLYCGDVAALEQGYYRRYIEPKNFATTTEVLLSASYGVFQMMGNSLYELGWFDQEFLRQPVQYREFYNNNSMDEVNVTKALNRYCNDLDYQVDTACRHLSKKRTAVGGDTRKILLAWNGGANQQYDDEVLAKMEKLRIELE